MNPWTENLLIPLKRLHEEGLSASQIAAELGHGLSRNAVIGKLHRLGLTLGKAPATLSPEERADRDRKRSAVKARAGHLGAQRRIEALRRRAAEQAADEAAVEVRPDAEIPEPQRCSLFDLRSDSCRWPIGDPGKPGFFFCGAIALDGQPYCPAHCARAFDGLKRPSQWRAAA